MRYSFTNGALNNVKGHISEHLVKQYIEGEIIPSLKKVGWDYAYFRRNLEGFFNRDDDTQPFYTSNGYILFNRELIACLRKLDALIGHEHKPDVFIPDGFLIKLKKTGEMDTPIAIANEAAVSAAFLYQMKSKNTTLELEMKCPTCGLLNMVKVETIVTKSALKPWYKFTHFKPLMVTKCKECRKLIAEPKDEIPRHQPKDLGPTQIEKQIDKLAVVTGEIEIIEVKSDKAHLQACQRKNYIELVNNGFVLRIFRVKIVSFAENNFEITETIVKNANEI